MKKLFIFLTIISLFTIFVCNIYSDTKISNIGVHGFLNTENSTTDKNQFGGKNSDISSAFMYGIYSSFKISSFYFQPEINFVYKGYGEHLNYVSNELKNVGEEEYSMYTSYIEVPLLLKYKLPLPILKPFILFGGRFDYLLDAKAGNSTSLNQKLNYFKKDIKSDFEKVDYGLIFGVGVEIGLLSKFDLVFDFRYSYGLFDIYKGDGEIYTRGYQMMCGLQYNF